MFGVKEKLEKRRKIKFFIFLSLFLVSLVVFGVCLFRVFENKKENDKIDSEYKVLTNAKEQSEQKEAEIPQFHKDLRDKNNDYVGWIEIPGTKVNYPIVRADDNIKYLNRTFEGTKSEVGAIFMDAFCDSNFESSSIVIHGHSRLDKSMFGELHSYRNESFKNSHSKIIIKTLRGKELVYKVFYSGVVDKSDEVYESRGDEERSQKYANSRGIGENKKLLTLSTCISPGDSPKRKIVQAFLEETVSR